MSKKSISLIVGIVVLCFASFYLGRHLGSLSVTATPAVAPVVRVIQSDDSEYVKVLEEAIKKGNELYAQRDANNRTIMTRWKESKEENKLLIDQLRTLGVTPVTSDK